MRIEGLVSGGGGEGTIVFVFGRALYGIQSTKPPALPILTDLQQKGVIVAAPIVSRPFNTKVLAFAWNKPRTPEDVAAQRAALEAHAGTKLFTEVHALDIAGVTTATVEGGERNVTYLDGGELVVAVARKYAERIGEVSRFLRDPQRADWMFQEIFAAATSHENLEKRLLVYEALVAYPVPSASNEYRPTYLRALNNAICDATTLKQFERGKAYAERGRLFVKENPYLAHSAACIFAQTGDLDVALELVAAAVKFKYEHVDQMKLDPDLAPLHARPEFAAAFEGAANKSGAKRPTASAAKKVPSKVTPKKKP